MSPSASQRSTTIRIDGMHCPSCDILVKTQLESVHGIVDVIPDHRSKTVRIVHTQPLTLTQVNAVLCDYGYTASSLSDVVVEDPLSQRVTEALIIAGILGIGYYFAHEFGLIPSSMGNAVTSVSGAFVLGLIASASTCMATTGALFASFMHKNRSTTSTLTFAGLFIVGRVVSYAMFGYILGSFGQLFSVFTRLGSVLNIVIAITLIMAGLDMLKIFPLTRIFDILPIKPSQIFSRYTGRKRMQGAGAFLLGFTTYLLPCGFTISTQAYAMGLGDPILSSQIMTGFALGTVPSLIFITLLTQVRNTPLYQYFLKAVGVIVIVVGINYVISVATLHGLSLSKLSGSGDFTGETAMVKDGVQTVHMTATSSGYSPSKFIVRKGIPVRWEIDGKEIYGCQGSIQSPQAGIALTYLREGDNVLEFIPKETGIINFSCSMGMFSGQFKVIES